jgi:2-methylisocitrate lyase-like PEP mutase family enzyme
VSVLLRSSLGSLQLTRTAQAAATLWQICRLPRRSLHPHNHRLRRAQQRLDIFVLARTDALIHRWDEAITRAKKFRDIGVDAVFIEALPDRESMRKAVEEIGIPTFANIIEGGLTEYLSVKDLAELGFAAVAYPRTLVATKLRSIRETLEG